MVLLPALECSQGRSNRALSYHSPHVLLGFAQNAGSSDDLGKTRTLCDPSEPQTPSVIRRRRNGSVGVALIQLVANESLG